MLTEYLEKRDIMIRRFSFGDIRKYLEKKNQLGILEAFDQLADAAMIFAPVFLGPQFLPLLELLDVKDRLVGLSKTVIGAIAEKVDEDYLGRSERLRTAYSLICYTAYFDTLSAYLPNDVLKKLIKQFKNDSALGESDGEDREEIAPKEFYTLIPYMDHITPFSQVQDLLLKMYIDASKHILGVVKQFNIYGKEKKKFNDISALLTDFIPQKAIERYKDQYLELATKFEDFGFYVQSLEFESLHNAAHQQEELLRKVDRNIVGIDFGLTNLSHFIQALPNKYVEMQSQEIVQDLENKYKAAINQPIIDDKEITPPDEPSQLKFPKIIDAFIPQSYKCLSYDPKLRLEESRTWEKIDRQDNLNLFFIKYLFSPDSIDYPLVILGHPGSGKSLLTKVLSAQLMSQSYTVVRIPLREVNAEATIDSLVEDQIKKEINRTLPSGGYGAFASQFKEKPIIIILDGYDELLQAKGDVFAGYLDRAKRFQADQKALQRPVRIILTSRITLIDKAIVPEGTTILRLLEFNEEQRNAWIRVWNNTNAGYFQSSMPPIAPFALPAAGKADEKSSNSIIELAEQPLLLLMLAIYDSEGNSLSELKNNLIRTSLYDSLIRRFVRRERSRYIADFNEKAPKEQEDIIDKEMDRLGVVAIAMFNRQKLFVHTDELQHDLGFFKLGGQTHNRASGKLKDSEALLGGFFFIHKSTAQDVSANSEQVDSTFEFLHNTFGEFLTANAILKNAVKETVSLDACRKTDVLRDMVKQKLNSPDGLDTGWFASLMFTPLYSRPVVLEMIQEHLQSIIEKHNISFDAFSENFELIITHQLKMILTSHTLPKIMLEDSGIRSDIPVLGLISIYTLNLVILASVIAKDGFTINEKAYLRKENSPSETKPWEKLAFLWKSWFSTENLTGLSVIFTARHDGDSVIVTCRKKFEAKSIKNPIDIRLSVNYTLGDLLGVGLAGLQSKKCFDVVGLSNREISTLLKDINIDICVSFLILQLNKLLWCTETPLHAKDYHEANELVREIIRNGSPNDVNPNTMINIFGTLKRTLDQNLLFLQTRETVFKYIGDCVHNIGVSGAMLSGFNIHSLLEKITSGNVGTHLAFGYRLFDKSDLYRRNIIFRSNDILGHSPTWYEHELLSQHNDFAILQNYDAIKKFLWEPVIPEKDKQRVIRRFISHYGGILAQTNPIVVTEIIVYYIANRVHDISYNLIDELLSHIIQVDLGFIDLDVFTNLLRIAADAPKVICERIEETIGILLKRTRGNSIVSIIYNAPEFLEAIVDSAPNLLRIISESIAHNQLPFFGEPEITYGRTKLISYISLLCKLSTPFYREKYKTLFDVVNSIIPDKVIQRCFQDEQYLKQLSIEDLNIAYKYFDQIKSKKTCTTIERLAKSIGQKTPSR